MASRVNVPGIGPQYFPDEMSDDEIYRRVAELQAQHAPKASEYDPRDLPAGELFGGALARTWESIKGTALEHAPAELAATFGHEDYARKKEAEYAERMARAEEEHPTAYGNFRDIERLSDIPKASAEFLGGALPSAGVGVGAGLVGAAAAPVVGLGTAAGASLGSMAGMYALDQPESFESIYRETGQLRPGLASIIGAGKAFLDAVTPGRILKQFGVGGEKAVINHLIENSKVVPSFWKQAAGEVLKTGAGESVTEGAQQALDIFGAHLADEKHPLATQENFDSVVTSMLQGLVGGTALGTPGAVAQSRRVQGSVEDRLAGLGPEIGGIAGEEVTPEIKEPIPETPAAPVQQPEISPQDLAEVTGEAPPAEPVQAPTELPKKFTTEELSATGLPATSGFFKNLRAIDLSTPDGLTKLKDISDRVAKSKNEKITPEIKSAVADLYTKTQEAYSQAPAEQRGVDITEGELQRVPEGLPTEGGGAGVGIPVEQRGEPGVPEGVGAPVPGGLGDVTPVPSAGGVREGLPERALEETSGAYPDIGRLPMDVNKFSDVQHGHELLSRYVEHGTDPELKDLATTLMASPYAKDVGVAFVKQGDVPPPAVARMFNSGAMGVTHTTETGSNMFFRSDDPTGFTEDTVVHEGIHGLTSAAIRRSPHLKGQLHDLSVQIARALEDSASKTKSPETKEAADFWRKAVAHNPAEVLTYSLTSPTFRKLLKEYAADGKPFSAARQHFEMDKVRAGQRPGRAPTPPEKLSLYQRFMDFIRKLFKLPEKNKEAFDKAMLAYQNRLEEHEAAKDRYNTLTPLTDRLHRTLNALLEDTKAKGIALEKQGAPETEAMHALVPNLPDNFEGIKGPFDTMRVVDKAIANFPMTGTKQQGVISQAFHKLGTTAQRFLLELLPGHALSDAAETQKIFRKGVASSYHSVMQRHDGLMHEMNAEVNEVNAHKFRNAMKVARGQLSAFNRMTNLSTEHQYDPSKKDPEKSIKELSQFSMGYIEFNPDGTQKQEVVKYFNTIQERNKAIADHNKNHPEEERAFVHRDAADADTIAKAREIQTMWKSLNGAWKDLYKSLRNANSEILKTYKSSIGSRIDSLTELDEGQRILQKKNILTKLAEHGMIEPYFTLGREGDHWLSAEIPNPDGIYTEQFTTAFKNPMERSQLETKLKNYVYKIEQARNIRAGMPAQQAHEEAMKTAMQRVRVYANVDDMNFKSLPSTSIINDILASVKRQSPPQGPNESDAAYNARTEKFNQITDDILRTVIHALPETSFVKNLQKRKGTAGYNEDVMSTFERKSRNSIRQIANLRFKPSLDAVLQEMKDYTELLGRGDETTLPRDNSTQKLYTEAFIKHANMALKPSISELGRALKGGVFTGTLGFNISSGLIELSNIPMIAFPYLGAEYGMPNTFKAIAKAHRIVRGSGKVRKVSPYGAEITGDVESELLKSGKSITNYAPDSAIGDRYARAIQIWKDAGQLNRSQLYELLMGSSRTTQLDRLNAMSGWMMHEMGRYNREVSLVAAYELEMEKLQKANRRNKTNPMSEKDMQEKAANTALHNTEMVNGSIAAASAPTLAQNDVGSLIYMYKRFGVSQYYTLIRTAMDAFKYEKDPKMRAALRRRLGYMIGSVGIMSGVRGLPIFGLLAALWDTLKDDDDEDLDTLARGVLPDFLANGIPETVLGISLTDRLGESNLLFREPKGDTASFSQWLVEAVGGPLPGLADRWKRGYDLVGAGHTERGIEMMMPVFVANVMKAVRYATTGRAESLRGDPIVSDLTLKDSAAQFMGFTSEPVAKAMEFDSKAKGISEAITKKETNAKRKYLLGYTHDDQEAMDEARQNLVDLGEKYPELGIDESTVDGILAKSLKLQQKNTEKMIGGKLYPKKHMERIQQLMEDWDLSTGPEGELIEE